MILWTLGHGCVAQESLNLTKAAECLLSLSRHKTILLREEWCAAPLQQMAEIPRVAGPQVVWMSVCPVWRSRLQLGRLGGSAGPAARTQLYGSPDHAGFSSCRSRSFPVAGICGRLALCYPLLFPPYISEVWMQRSVCVSVEETAPGETHCWIQRNSQSFPIAEVQRGWLPAWHPPRDVMWKRSGDDSWALCTWFNNSNYNLNYLFFFFKMVPSLAV